MNKHKMTKDDIRVSFAWLMLIVPTGVINGLVLHYCPAYWLGLSIPLSCIIVFFGVLLIVVKLGWLDDIEGE